MSETKFTPGPWKWEFINAAIEGAKDDWAIVTDTAHGIIANVNTETGPDAISAPAMRKMPADANARLIAAAPDLLEACEAALEEWGRLPGSAQLGINPKVGNMLVAAIRKAKGEAKAK